MPTFPYRMILVVAALGLSGAGSKSPATLGAAANLCAPPTDDVRSWREVSIPYITIRIPPGFSNAGRGDSWMAYTAGGRAIGMQWGEHGGMPSALGLYAINMQSVCQVALGNRPAEITVYSWDVYDKPLTPTEGAGAHYAAVARWQSFNGQPTVYVWIISRVRSDLMPLREVFWTAQFAGIAADTSTATRCAGLVPSHGVVDDLIDTAFVTQLISGSTPPIPDGNAVMEITFDSSGAAAGINVTASGLPTEAQRQLASIIGSNIKPQAAAAPRAGIRAEVASSAVSYSLVPVSACAPH